MKALVFVLLAAAAALAQVDGGSVAGPVLGLVFDRNGGAIRPILGVPASSTLGAPMDGDALSDAAVSARRGYAVGFDQEGAAVIVTAAGRRPLAGAKQGATVAIVSPRGLAAALYSPSFGSAQIFVGMPEAPREARTVTLDPSAAAIALSDDGETLLAASRNGRAGDTLYAYQASAAPRMLYHATHVAAVAFVPGGSNALLAEPHVVKLISPAFGEQTVADALEGVSAVAASEDGSRVVIATRSGRIVIHDLPSSTEVSVTCSCRPGVLAPLRGNAVFRLNEVGGGPLWVLDADSPDPLIRFVSTLAGGAQ